MLSERSSSARRVCLATRGKQPFFSGQRIRIALCDDVVQHAHDFRSMLIQSRQAQPEYVPRRRHDLICQVRGPPAQKTPTSSCSRCCARTRSESTSARTRLQRFLQQHGGSSQKRSLILREMQVCRVIQKGRKARNSIICRPAQRLRFHQPEGRTGRQGAARNRRLRGSAPASSRVAWLKFSSQLLVVSRLLVSRINAPSCGGHSSRRCSRNCPVPRFPQSQIEECAGSGVLREVSIADPAVAESPTS